MGVELNTHPLFVGLPCWHMEKNPRSEVSFFLYFIHRFPDADVSAARQERLLQGLMREIVRMTAHKQPLEVGAPLYPFSSSSLWRKGDSNGIAGVPMPTSSPFENGPSLSGLTSTTPPEFQSISGSGWLMSHDLSQSVSPTGGMGSL